MYLQPAFTMPQELLDFVITYPIVLIVIQNWHEHIEVGQQLAQAAGSLKRDCKIRTHPPFRALFVQGVAGYHQRIAQRFKKALEKAFTATTRYNSMCCLAQPPSKKEHYAWSKRRSSICPLRTRTAKVGSA